MALIRTILALIVLLILVHAGLFYAGIEQGDNVATDAIFSLGTLLESPAAVLLSVIPVSGELANVLDPGNFYAVALTAAAGYFILYLLLGVGRRG